MHSAYIEEYRKCVYNACRDNNMGVLKRLLSGRDPEFAKRALSELTNGATPLVMACRNGHYDIVYFLLYKLNVDCEQTGSVIFDGETIDGAPPLWCASAAGHLGIVKLLVKRGANVNCSTRTCSTPLRAACFDGHYDIVKYLVENGADVEVANRHGHTCLMIACYKRHYAIAQYLLLLKAEVNRRSVKGNTALHDCAESGALDILKLLLEHGATMDVDSYGMTPLLAASVTGHLEVVEHLISLPIVSREERISALEILGATYVDKKRDMVKALRFWRRALTERYLLEPNIPKPRTTRTVYAYDNTEEVTDVFELDELVMDPDAMRMQALVMRERILGPAHPDTSYYIRYRGAVYADAGRFNRCIDLWTYALTMQQDILEPLSPLTQSTLLSFAELFSYMLGEAGRPVTRGRVVPPIEINDLIFVFNKSVHEVELGYFKITKMPASEKDPLQLSRALVTALHLACLLSRFLTDDQCIEDETYRKQIYKALFGLVNLKIVLGTGRTALHLACHRESALVCRYPACQFPSTQLVKSLLMVGADPNAKDYHGNTPLHLAALAKPCPANLAQVLLNYGAHLDTTNDDGYTFESLLRGQKIHELVNPVKYTKLSCLAARTIRKHQIPYENLIPKHLYEFVSSH